MSKGRGISFRESKGPLPPGDGPNLHEFRYPDAPIKWIKRLDEDREGNQAFIYQGHDLEPDLIDSEVREALEGDTRVRAIVKHLDEGPKSLHSGNIGRAWTSVRLLNNSLKIYNMDIKADNFIGFRLVDFGSSWTEPHEILRYLDKEGKDIANHKRGRDAQNFEDMIEEEQIQTRLRVVPMSRYQLRSKGEAPWAGRPLPKRRRRNTSDLAKAVELQIRDGCSRRQILATRGTEDT
ncbi:hypothetical protein GGR58DRAFT_501221 [Xylaria digitata]|nr:hypothetical protein GGR58DRAFT_501221 [Xylaria digitata]